MWSRAFLLLCGCGRGRGESLYVRGDSRGDSRGEFRGELFRGDSLKPNGDFASTVASSAA